MLLVYFSQHTMQEGYAATSHLDMQHHAGPSQLSVYAASCIMIDAGQLSVYAAMLQPAPSALCAVAGVCSAQCSDATGVKSVSKISVSFAWGS